MKNIMEVAIDKLVANPFRNIEEYELQEENVSALMHSMQTTDLWLSFEARSTGDGKYQIAFGHHRLEAARRLGIETVTISVSDRSDLDMLDMMIQENHTRRDLPHVVVMEEVASTAAYWNTMLKAHPQYDHAPEDMRRRIKSKKHYHDAVQKGIGRPFLVEVLGGNVSDKAIAYALEMLRAIDEEDEEQTVSEIQPDDELEEIDTEEEEQEEPKPKKETKPQKRTTKEALGVFASQAQAKAFMDEMNDPDVSKVIAVSEHEAFAREIVAALGTELTVKSIKRYIRNEAMERIAKRAETEAERERETKDFELEEVRRKTKELGKASRDYATEISSYVDRLERVGVSERMSGVEVAELHNAIAVVVQQIERAAFYVGFTFEEMNDE